MENRNLLKTELLGFENDKSLNIIMIIFILLTLLTISILITAHYVKNWFKDITPSTGDIGIRGKRGNSGNDILFSIIAVYSMSIFFQKKFNELINIVLIILPIIIINLFLENIKHSSKQYLINNTNILNERIDLNYVRAHWHNAYYSLGYLNGENNNDVPEPTDTYSIEKARSINPDIVPYSKEYEKLLKNEYFKFIKNYPFFFVKIKLSKMGVIAFYIIIFLNIGIYYLLKNKCSKKNILFFIPGIILNSLFGIATEPNYTYLLGLFAYCSIFSTNVIDDFYLKSRKL